MKIEIELPDSCEQFINEYAKEWEDAGVDFTWQQALLISGLASELSNLADRMEKPYEQRPSGVPVALFVMEKITNASSSLLKKMG